MKTVYVATMMVVAVLMLLIPLTAAAPGEPPVTPAVGEDITEEPQQVRVKMQATGDVETYSLEDYLFGVVAAEMPALYEEEALKAQTVAAYTYYIRKKNSEGDYDITDDYRVDQAFITPAAAKEKWGDGAEKYSSRILSAVKEVMGKKITYDGQPISAVYHAVSGGRTERAKDIWGGDYPYLVAVDSSWDKQAPNYISTAIFTAAELKSALEALVGITDLENNCFGEPSRTESGSIKSISVAEATLTGQQIRSALSLKSADFDVTFADGVYTFTVRGYGHGIGMSQYGANCLAKEGKTYIEILTHYYPGCKVE